jgi:putative phosphoesterase
MLGLVSNSDGRADAVADALGVFAASGVETVVHLGDVGGRHVLDALAAAPAEVAFVWGDRDKDRMVLLRHAHKLGLLCWGLFGDLEHGGKRIAVLHGDDKKILKHLLDEQQYDYVLTGHEMSVEERTVGRTRVINPGPLHGAASRSAAVFDPASGKVTIVPL